jgi:hypothetical protein
MRLFLIISLLVLTACSHGPHRNLASEENLDAVPEHLFNFGQIDHQKSKIQLFPAESYGSQPQWFFSVELVNESGGPVDIDEDEMQIQHDGNFIAYQFDRIGQGKYTILMRQEDFELKKLKFIVQGKPIVKSCEQNLKAPSFARSKITVVEQGDHELTLQLELKDQTGNVLDAEPDININNGMTHIEQVRKIRAGIWQFKVIFPEENRILYFSVRANGFLLDKLFRYQHVEK